MNITLAVNGKECTFTKDQLEWLVQDAANVAVACVEDGSYIGMVSSAERIYNELNPFGVFDTDEDDMEIE